jgi:hypothetical protein
VLKRLIIQADNFFSMFSSGIRIKCQKRNFHQFVKNVFEKNNNTLLQNSLFFGTRIAKNHHNCLEYKRVHKIFLLSNFEYSQIWLNILPNDQQHLRSITELKKKIHLLRIISQ